MFELLFRLSAERHGVLRTRGRSPWSTTTTTAGLLSFLALLVAGCGNSGSRGNGVSQPSGVDSSVAPLEFDNAVYLTAEPEIPRYNHDAVQLPGGEVLIVGGSNESNFSSIGVTEIYVPSMEVNPTPESINGGFLSTDINGDPIEMVNGGRVYHTTNLLPSGNVLVCGGTADILVAGAIAEAEIFDIQGRQFNTDDVPANEMIVPRFRHTTTRLPSGRFLITGGQESVQQQFVDPNFPPSSPFFQFDLTVFPSTNTAEVFDPGTLEFSVALDTSEVPADLAANRGRTDHVTTALAGLDGRLGTTDDVILLAGGYNTFTGQFAPLEKFPGAAFSNIQQSLEYYDSQTGTFLTAPGILAGGHANGGHMMNLGFLRDDTFNTQPLDCPDFYEGFQTNSIGGLGNVALLFGGDDNAVNFCANSTRQNTLVLATFSGFGPANGAQFFQFEDALLNYGSGQASGIDPGAPDGCTWHGRSYGGAGATVGRQLVCGVEQSTPMIVAIGGEHANETPNGGCSISQFSFANCTVGEVAAPQIFYPLMNPRGLFPFVLTSEAPFQPYWDVSDAILNSPLAVAGDPGIRGAWITPDTTPPDGDTLIFRDETGFDFVGTTYADTYARNGVGPTGQLESMIGIRSQNTVTQIPGEDGVLDTPDDRVLVFGGGTQFYNGTLGGEAVPRNALIYLPPHANGFEN